MKLLRRSVQNQHICNHPYDEITSYLFFFFTNNAAFRRTLGIFRIHLQRQNTLLKEKDLCWFTLKNVLQEGQSQMPGGGDRQVRREERCAVLKTVYSEMWKQTSVSIPGIIAPYVVTSG